MTDLLDFATTHARKRDPQTSKDAAEGAERFAGGQCKIIMEHLDDRYPYAFSTEDLETALGFDCHRRIHDLSAAGLIVMAGHTILKSGLKGRTWRARGRE